MVMLRLMVYLGFQAFTTSNHRERGHKTLVEHIESPLNLDAFGCWVSRDVDEARIMV